MSPNIDDRALVSKWLEAIEKNENQSWIAEEFKVSRQAIAQRAAKLRKYGVKLPPLPRKPYTKRTVDVSGLNELINSRVER